MVDAICRRRCRNRAWESAQYVMLMGTGDACWLALSCTNMRFHDWNVTKLNYDLRKNSRFAAFISSYGSRVCQSMLSKYL